MSKEIITQELHPFQANFLDSVDKHRYSVLVCGRRSGKSHIMAVAALEWAINHAVNDDGQPETILILGTTQDNIKESMWATLQKVIPKEYVYKTVQTPHPTITFVNGARIVLRGMDKPDPIRGMSPSPSMICCDELSFMKRGVFEDVIEPLASDLEYAKYILIGTPNYPNDDLHKALQDGQNPKETEWCGFHYTALEARPDRAKQIARAKKRKDPISFRREYEASYETVGNLVFYNFNTNKHVLYDVEDFKDYETVNIGIDFNVGLMCAASFVIRNDKMYWLKEFQGASNTQELVEMIKQTYPNKHVVCYPDASGSARKTSAAQGVTDHTILRGAGFELLCRPKNPPIKDSINAVNTKLLTASGLVGMYFDSGCMNLIKSMNNTVYKNVEGSDDVTINKNGEEHHSDYVRYATEYLFPIQSRFRIDNNHKII